MTLLSSSTDIKIQTVALPFKSPLLLRKGVAIKDIVLFKATKVVTSSSGKEKSVVNEERQGFASIKELKKCIKDGAMPNGMNFLIGTPKIREFLRMFGTAMFAEHKSFLYFAKGAYTNAPDVNCIRPVDELSRLYSEEYQLFLKPSDRKDAYFPTVNWFDMYESNPAFYMELIENNLIYGDHSSHTLQLMRDFSLINFSLFDSGVRFKSSTYRNYETIFADLASSGNIIYSDGEYSNGSDIKHHTEIYKKCLERDHFGSIYSGCCYISFTDEQFAKIKSEFESNGAATSVHDELSKSRATAPNNRDVIYQAVFKADPFGIKENAYFPDDYYGHLEESDPESDDD